MALGVPSPFRQAFLLLVGLEQSDANALLQAFQETQEYQPVERLRELATAALANEHAPQVERLIPALLSLRGQTRRTAPARVAEALAQSPDLEIKHEERETLRERVQALLDTPAMRTTADAVELLTQHDRNYQTARIFSDIRPVFPGDAGERPTGAVVVEMLQIQTWDRDGTEETLYIAMDHVDLRELQEVVARAIVKTETLRTVLEEQGMAYFDLDKREL